MSSDPNDVDPKPPEPPKPPVEQEWVPPDQPTGYSVVKTLAIIFLGVPAVLIVIAAMVLGVCLLA
jgi:hypothetical protein